MKHIFPFFRMDTASGGEGGAGTGTGNTTPDANAEAANKIKELEAALEKERKEKTGLAGKISSLSSDIEKIRTQGLKSKEDYKTLSESLEAQVGTLQSENSKLKDSIFHTSRVGAVKDAAVKLGLRSAALSDIEAMDLDEIKVAVGDDRMIRVEGAGEYANKLKTLKPYLFETPRDPLINTGGGAGGAGGGAGDITQQQMATAYQLRNKGPAERKAYYDLQTKYDEQTRKAKAK